MAYKVVTTPSFDERLDTAVAYRLAQVGPKSTSNLLAAVEKVARTLASLPERGQVLELANPLVTPLRWVPAKPYIIIYVIHERDKTVQLVDLFYGTKNWRERLSAG